MKYTVAMATLLSAMWMQIAAHTYTYTLTWLEPHTKTFVIDVKANADEGAYTDFAIPAWRPGRYYLQDYSAAVSNFSAKSGAKTQLNWRKINKDTWRVFHGDQEVDDITISYHYFANNQDAGSSYLSIDQVYFNPVNLFMYKPGQLDGDVELNIPNLDLNWKRATALTQTDNQRVFTAKSFHEFADSPTVFSSKMKQLSFEDQGTTIYIHVQGNYQGDEAADQGLIELLQTICAEQAAIFGGYPMKEFHFIYRLLPYNISHGVEHMYSTSIAYPELATRNKVALVSKFKGTSTHEFWHVWNVKRIRPEAMWPYDYSQPQYTSLHWFTEGVTSYYTSLTLIRTQYYDQDQFLRILSRDIQSLENNYATKVVSPSQMSFDSWLSRSPYGMAHTNVSYYSAGSRLGLILDLRIRAQTKGEKSLDDVFRYLYKTYYAQDKGVPEDGVQDAIESITGESWKDFFDKHVHGTESLDYKKILKPFGLELTIAETEEPGTRGIGIISAENTSQGLYIKRLHRSGDAFLDGLAEGNLILEIDGQSFGRIDFDDYLNQNKGKNIELQVFADGEIRTVNIAYNGRFVPSTYELKRVKKPSKKQESLFLDWVSSKVKS